MSARLFAAVAAPIAALMMSTAPAVAADTQLAAAVAGSHRAAANVVRDPARRPVESLKFWGLKPNQTVIELSPGAGYWTEILAPYAKTTGGRYVAAVADLEDPKLSEGAKKGRATFEAKVADEAVYGKVTLANFGGQSKPLGPAGSADIVLTARNIHNWMWVEGMLDKVLKDAYDVLKPGGFLAVEEHRSDPRPQVADAKDGYVAMANVVAAAEKAGFKLDAKSEINANAKDTKDHPFGVWTLPPVRRQPPAGDATAATFDKAKYEAIGESDRMTLRFVKPR